MSQEEIHEVVDDCHSSGFQVGIHANGDVAIETHPLTGIAGQSQVPGYFAVLRPQG